MRRFLLSNAIVIFVGLLTATNATAQSLVDPALQVTTFVSGLSQPTSIALLPGTDPQEMLVCEKATGRVRWVSQGAILGTALDLAVNSVSERGLLGIALHPDFDTNGFVYLYYTNSTTGGDTTSFAATSAQLVERYTWNGATLVAPLLILTLPVTGGPNHDGGIILFGTDGKLYGVIGDLNRNGQLENFPLGATPDDTAIIFRINDNGTAPTDNPFYALGGSMQKVYAYGVRNSFGLDFDPVTGDIWDTENGPGSYDEINRVGPGFNSGWEQIMGPDSRDPQGQGDLWQAANSQYSDPEFSWLTPIGVTSIHFIRSNVLGDLYETDCLVGDNNNGRLYHYEVTPDRQALVMPTGGVLDLVADNSTERDVFLFGTGFGVTTDIETGPGGIYVSSLTSGAIRLISRQKTSDLGPHPATYLQLTVHPNPTRTMARLLLPGGDVANYSARIFSPDGRLVRVLTGGKTQLLWDGKDAHGRPVAAGVYLVRVDGDAAESLRGKVILMR